MGGAGRAIRPGRRSARSASVTSPSRRARVAISVRLWTWSFSRMLRRWYLTVFSEMPSSAAISLFRRPAVTRRRTSSSRAVSRSGGGFVGRRLQAQKVADDPGGGGGRDGRVTTGHRVDHRPQLGRLEVLEQVAACTGPDRREQVLLVLADGEHHDRGLRADGGDRPGRLDPAHPRHPHVHQDQVGFEPDHERRPPGRRRRRGRRRRGPRPRGATSGRRGRGRGRRRGRSASGDPVDGRGRDGGRDRQVDRQPPSGGSVHSRVAPMASARSRIARSP